MSRIRWALGGPVSNAGVSLGPTHPDNPYFGTEARLRYLAFDNGPRVRNGDSDFYRVLVGLKGTAAEWEYDTGLLYSRDQGPRHSNLQRDVTFALLNPSAANVAAATAGSAAYAALPPGTVWRIAENASLNSPALYAAMSPAITSDWLAKITQIDVKASREIGKLEGGPVGIAVGAELRRESVGLTPVSYGTEHGNVIGLGYSAYDGGRTVAAGYVEVLAPVSTSSSCSPAALRYDHYSDAGSSAHAEVRHQVHPDPRAGAARDLPAARAPSPAERRRRPGGVLDGRRSGALQPGHRRGVRAGGRRGHHVAEYGAQARKVGQLHRRPGVRAVLEDEHRRRLLRHQAEERDQPGADQRAVTAGHIARDPTTATAVPAIPGQIVAVLSHCVQFVADEGARLRRRRQAGLRPRRRLRQADVDRAVDAPVHLQAHRSRRHLARFRRHARQLRCRGLPSAPPPTAPISARSSTPPPIASASTPSTAPAFRTRTSRTTRPLASTFADRSRSPGSRIASFTTFDLVGRWLPTKNLEIYGWIRNLFDRVAPLDLSYGQQSFNPLDYAGGVGRFYTVGLKYRFF